MEEKLIKSYKGFNKDMKCLDFQYEVGKEYELDGDIIKADTWYKLINGEFEEVNP